MLNVRATGFQGKHKLADRWEDKVYVVVGQPGPSVPVYVIEPEDGAGRSQTLHRNMLLPLTLPLDDENQAVGVQKSSSCHSRSNPKSPATASELHESSVSNVDVFSLSESSEESEVDCHPVTWLLIRKQRQKLGRATVGDRNEVSDALSEQEENSSDDIDDSVVLDDWWNAHLRPVCSETRALTGSLTCQDFLFPRGHRREQTYEIVIMYNVLGYY